MDDRDTCACRPPSNPSRSTSNIGHSTEDGVRRFVTSPKSYGRLHAIGGGMINLQESHRASTLMEWYRCVMDGQRWHSLAVVGL